MLLLRTVLLLVVTSPVLLAQGWQEKYQRALSFVERGLCSKAIHQFTALLPEANEAFQFNDQDHRYIHGLSHLGDCHQALNRLDQALDYYQILQELEQHGYELPDSLHGHAYLQSAQILFNQGKFTEAEAQGLKALEVYSQRLQNLEKHGYALRLMGQISSNLGRPQAARSYYRQALVANDTPNPQLMMELARLYLKLENYDSAYFLFQESLQLVKANSGDSTAQFADAMEQLATYHIAHKEFSKAEKLLQDATAIYSDDLRLKTSAYTSTVLNHAYVHRLQGEYDKALDLFDLAFSNLKKSQLASEPQYAVWISRYLVTKIAAEKYDDAEKWVLLAKENYINQIIRFFPHLTEKEKEAFYADIRWRFEAFNSFALLRYQQNPAIAGVMYDNQLISKAILLNETNKWKKNILASGDVQLITQFADWQQKKQLLGKYLQDPSNASTKPLLRQLKKEVAGMEKALTNRSELFANGGEGKAYSWRDVQKALKSSEAAVEMIRFRIFDFAMGNQFTDRVFYVALVVLPNSKHPEMVVMKNGNDLEGKLLLNYRNGMLFQQADSLSYRNYWQPLLGALKGSERIYFSNDGVYNHLNLNTIYNPDRGDYLLSEYDINVLTNTKDLLEDPPTDDKNNFAVLLGNPNYGTADSGPPDNPNAKVDLAQLPGTRKEIQLINDLLRSRDWDRDIYLGPRAGEKQLKSIFKPKILHIATHGFFKPITDLAGDETNPLFHSGLYLANPSGAEIEPGMENDGIFTAYEAMQLNLDDTELVVLSACETGLGEVKNGEGVYGLQRAFKVAGARNIIMSLWKVNDETTQQLMTTFYQKWLEAGDKHIAFRQAQLEMKLKDGSPFHWGSFIIVGN